MWRYYTRQDRREATSSIATLVLVGVVLAAAGLIGVQYLLRGLPSELTAWPAAVISGPWPLGAGAAALLVAGWTVTAVKVVWPSMAPTGMGFATRNELARELGEGTARKSAKVTRPDLDWRGRAAASTLDLSIPMHRSLATGQRCCLPLENATGVIAPQQSGKSLMDLLHKILAAPGGLLVTGTKLDLYWLTALARARGGVRPGRKSRPRPVHVLDLTGSAHYGLAVRWNPIDGCTDWSTATRRAESLMVSAGGGSSSMGNHAFFHQRATTVLACYLLAAGVAGVPLDRFVSWCQDDTDNEAVSILGEHPEFAPQRDTLSKAQQVVDETRSGIWETLRNGIRAFADRRVIAACTPDAQTPAFDVEAFIAGQGTVYVIGSESDAALQAGYVTAFVETVFETVKRLALQSERGRLAPPFTAVLDELTNICPLPKLPGTLSDSAGRGLLVHWAMQSLSQAQERWGNDAAQTLMDNTTAVTVFGGIKSESTLKWVATLAGERDVERVSRSQQSGLSIERGTRQTSLERRPVLEAGAVRMIPRLRAVLIMRHLPPVMVRMLPGWKRPDWKILQADRDTVRRTPPATPTQLIVEPPEQVLSNV